MMEVDEEDSISDADRAAILKSLDSFKDLTKPTISETYKAVRKLIGKKEIQKYKNIGKLMMPETPLPLFHECLRLALIDCLKLENEVVKILLNQNDKQIRRIFGCKWFFRALPFDFCTTQIFPYVSVNVRNRIVVQLSKYLQREDEAEKYFTYFRKNYDYQRADYLLPKCSSQFISNHFKNHQTLLDHPCELRLLSVICRRHPEVGLHILECDFLRRKNLFELMKYKRIVLYLAGNHPDIFLPFLKKHHHLLQREMFGRKITKKLGMTLQNEFLANTVGTTPFKFKLLFANFPFEIRVKCVVNLLYYEGGSSTREWGYLTYKLCDILRTIAAEDRLALIQAVFQQMYNLSFDSNSEYWNCYLLELLPLETRTSYIMKIEKNFDPEVKIYDRTLTSGFRIRCPEHYIYMLDFETAFERHRNMLRTAPLPNDRIDILDQMVKNCSLNSDLKGLQQVVDFVVARCRNDDHKVLNSFIGSVLANFSWTKLTPVTYERLDELFHLCTLRGDVDWNLYKRWKERQIFYLLENGRDVSHQIDGYFQNGFLKNNYETFLDDYRCRHSKTLLVALGTKTVNWIRDSPGEKANNLRISLLRTCKHFRRASPSIDIWTEIPGLNEILLEKLRTKYGEAGGEQWSLDVWRRYPKDVNRPYCDPTCLLYVLMRKPDFVQTHLEGMLNCLLSTFDSEARKRYKSYFDHLLKLASFFDKTEKVKQFLLKEFKTGSPVEKRNMALLLYSEMSTIEEFNQVVQDYFPQQENIDADTDVDFGKTQLLVPSLIKNVRPRWKNFDFIFKFYMGDFLKRVKPSLYACCQYTRVDVVVPMLKKRFELLPPKVSCQKDIVRLIVDLCTREERLRFCVEFWERHKHYSIRSILFHYLTKLFREQPTREVYRMVEKFVLESDNLTITKMPDLGDVPDEYLREYVDALMKFSEKQEPSFRDDFQNSVLKHFTTKRIKLLSTDFCVNLLKNHLFRSESNLQVTEFAYTYLREGRGSVEERAYTIFNMVNENKPSPGYVYFFVDLLMERAIKEPLAFAELFQAVLKNWPKYDAGILYQERVVFVHHVLYQKTLGRRLTAEDTMSEFAKELNRMYCGVENLKEMLVIYGEALKKFMGNFETTKALAMIVELVKEATDKMVAVLGVLALPKDAKDWYWMKDNPLDQVTGQRKKVAREVYEAFDAYGDETVHIYLRRKYYSGV